jgi:capsular exopolysaccharide synthesis family protein
MNTNPASPIAEEYRILRTNIEFSALDKVMKVIAVTSSDAGEGKSTTSANLAVAFAQAGKQVLLIDANLRKPALHHIFAVSNHEGLTNVLFGQSDAADVIKLTDTDNLSVLPSGPRPPNPAELLSSKRLEELLGQIREKFDAVIIDTPSIKNMVDAQLVASQSDGVVLVVHSGKAKKEMVRKAKANLEHVKARIVGVVLNRMRPKTQPLYG